MAGSLIVLAIVAAFGALGPSRLLVVLVAIVLGVPARWPARLRLPRAEQPPRRRPTDVPSPASRLGSRWRGSSVRSPRPPSGFRSRSAWPSSPSVSCLQLLYVLRSLREASEPTWATHSIRSSWPVDDSSTPPSGTAQLDRLAVTELSGVIDLARATGMPLAAETVSMDELRSIARRPGRSTLVTSNGRSLESVSSSTDSSGGRAVSRARASRSRRRGRQDSGNSDDEVTTSSTSRRRS